MPRPTQQPQEPASAFDHHLRELSAEFERLLRRNLELASRCGELGVAGGAPEGDVRPCCAQPWPLSPPWSGEVVGGQGRPSSVEKVPGPASAVHWPKGPDGAKGELGVSAWAEKAAGALQVQQPDSGDGALQVQGPAPQVLGPGSDNTDNATQVPAPALPSAPTIMPVRHKDLRQTKRTMSPTNFYEQFRILDSDDVGILTINDVQRILWAANECVTREGLTHLFRIANGRDMVALRTGDTAVSLTRSEAEEAADYEENPGMDYWAFLRVMTDDPELWESYPRATEDCFHSFRRACTPKSKKTHTFHCPPPRQKSVGPSTAYKVTAFWLETIPTVVILLNALVTGLSADHPEQEYWWEVIEYIFVSFYAVECGVKMCLFGVRAYFCTSREHWWNLFDFACLIISLAEVVSTIAVSLFVDSDSKPDLGAFLLIKIFRLARLARLVRTLRFKVFHELKLMILGVYSGLRVLTWAIVLLVVLIYVFGVASTNLFSEEEEFRTVLRSMFTQFRCWTEGCSAYDGTPLSERLRERHGPIFMVYYILLTMFVTVGLFNLIMAMFIDNVVTTQQHRKHKDMAERTQEIEQKFKRLFFELIKNGVESKRKGNSLYQRMFREFKSVKTVEHITSGGRRGSVDSSFDMEWEKLRQMDMAITRDVFRAWLRDPEFLQLLEEAEIETTNQFELFDVLDVDMSGELSMAELMHGLMRLRGPVTKADIVAVRLKMRHVQCLIEGSSRA